MAKNGVKKIYRLNKSRYTMSAVFFMFTVFPFSPVNRMWQVSFFYAKKLKKAFDILYNNVII